MNDFRIVRLDKSIAIVIKYLNDIYDKTLDFINT